LNSFDPGATYKMTINVRKIDEEEFKKSILIPMHFDYLDRYRDEYNKLLLKDATGANGFIQEKYLTVSISKNNIQDARNYFSRVDTDLNSHYMNLGSKCESLSYKDRLKIFHDFNHDGEEGNFHFDIHDAMKKGHNFKDTICSDSLEIQADYFKIGERYGRVFYLKDYANFIKDSMLSELCDYNQNLMMSFDLLPIPTDEAVREVENRVLGVETNITNWQRRQNANQNFSAVIPYDMEQQRKESKEFLDDLTARDQRMMFGLMTIVIMADDKEDLDYKTDTLQSTARKHLCQLAILKWQQLDGLNTVLPYGVRKINALRTLTTESVAVFIPFRVQEIQDVKGIYYGKNAISNNLLICNKANLLNPNAFRLGVPGSGKSFGAKEEIAFLAISTEDDILICDPEKEYGTLIEELGGENIHIAAGSHNHINAMDMDLHYGESNNPVIEKSQFILSLFEQLETNRILGAKERSIIDRCTANIYRKAKEQDFIPTLLTLKEELLLQSEIEAQDLALSMELFTSGSLDTFAHTTNVDTNNRMVVYDISELGTQLKTLGLLVITDAMLNRVSRNWRLGKRTHVFIDELHVVFENEHSASFFVSAWRRFRKRNAFPTGLTQNVEYLLASVDARTMLSNSEFIVMHNQSASDRKELANLLNISSQQLSHVTNAPAGSGLLRVGHAIVPFVNTFPKDTQLYKLMTTKPNE
jgi:hypothetical protein